MSLIRVASLASYLLLVVIQTCSAQSSLWQSYLKTGMSLMEKKEYEAAEKLLRSAILELDAVTENRANYSMVLAHAQLAGCLRDEHKYEESEAEFLKTATLALSTETERTFFMVYDSLGSVQAILKKFDLAEANYKKCMRLIEEYHQGPKFQQRVLQDLIALYRLEGKDAEASALMDQLPALDAQIKQIESSPKYFYEQGLISLTAKDYPKSIELFEKAMELTPLPLYAVNLAVAHQNYAVALADKDGGKDAEYHYKEAIKLFEKDAHAKSQLADSLESLVILYIKDKRYADAEPHVKRLLTLRNEQQNFVGYAGAYRLYATVMKAENKPLNIGPVPAGLSSAKSETKSRDELAEYDHALKLHIHQKWRELDGKYSLLSAQKTGGIQPPLRGSESTRIWIVIGPDGALKDHKIDSVNRNEQFENRAFESIQNSFPYRALPRSAGNTHSLSVYFTRYGVN